MNLCLILFKFGHSKYKCSCDLVGLGVGGGEGEGWGWEGEGRIWERGEEGKVGGKEGERKGCKEGVLLCCCLIVHEQHNCTDSTFVVGLINFH